MSSTAAASPLARRVDAYLQAHRVGPEEVILVAFSGGPDSTALLHLLHEIRSSTVVCCHVDHHLRDEAERANEDRTVAASAAMIGVQLHIRRLGENEILETARAQKRSVEEVARELRYSLLREVQRETGAGWIALGHTRNDQVETILMRLFQGSGIGGLKGIPEFRPAILRPLLGTSRSELLDYLAHNGLPFAEDSTNLEPVYLRNRIRLTLLPAIESIFPGFLDAVAESGRSIALADEALEFASKTLLDWRQTPDGFEIEAERLMSVPHAIRMRSLLTRLNQLGVGGRVPNGFFAPLRRHQVGCEGTILRGRGVRMDERGGIIRLLRDVVLPAKKSYLIRVHGLNLYHITRTLSMEVTSRRCAGTIGNAVCAALEQGRQPVVVRSRRPGDSILMESGTKKLKKLFADWGVKHRHRDLIPIVEDRSGIVAVAGSPFGYPDRVRRGAEISDDERRQVMVFVFENSGDEV